MKGRDAGGSWTGGNWVSLGVTEVASQTLKDGQEKRIAGKGEEHKQRPLSLFKGNKAAQRAMFSCPLNSLWTLPGSACPTTVMKARPRSLGVHCSPEQSPSTEKAELFFALTWKENECNDIRGPVILSFL